MDKDIDLKVTAIEEAMAVMTRALRRLQCYSPSMDAGALNLSLGIAIRMEKAADDLKAASKLLRETNINWMAHQSTKK